MVIQATYVELYHNDIEVYYPCEIDTENNNEMSIEWDKPIDVYGPKEKYTIENIDELNECPFDEYVEIDDIRYESHNIDMYSPMSREIVDAF